MRYLSLFVLMLLISLTASGQEGDRYRLRVPSAEEYLRGINTIQDESLTFMHPLYMTSAYEYDLRYHDVALNTLPFEDLDQFITQFDLIHVPQSVDIWYPRMLEAGLRDQDVREIPETMSLGHFEIISQEVDFNGDSEPDYFLEVYGVIGIEDKIFYAIAIPRPAGGFDLFYAPVPFTGSFSTSFTHGLPPTSVTTKYLEDIDKDGSTEWVATLTYSGYWADCVILYAIDWQENELVNLAQDFEYCGKLNSTPQKNFHFSYDDSGRLTIEATWWEIDSWNCSHIKAAQLIFISGRLTSRVGEFLETTGWCDLFRAQEAVQQNDYASAAHFFEYALEGETIPEYIQLYIQTRLAIAYALDNQSEKAEEIFNTVQPVGRMGDFFIQVKDGYRSNGGEGACQAAYDFFQEIISNGINDNEWEDITAWKAGQFHFGRDRYPTSNHHYPFPSVAGCDTGVSPVPTFTPMPTLNPTEKNISVLEDSLRNSWNPLHSYMRDVIVGGLRREAFEQTLNSIDQALEIVANSSPADTIINLKYWRAITFEFMGREDEALAEYVAIYEADPESAWGMLAALHFEVVK